MGFWVYFGDVSAFVVCLLVGFMMFHVSGCTCFWFLVGFGVSIVAGFVGVGSGLV